MGYKGHLRTEMPGEESIVVKDNHQWQKEKKRELARSEIAKCNEDRDIRDKVVSGDPFTHSANRNLSRELKPNDGMFSSRPQQDSNLSADTTLPSENKIGKAPQPKGDAFTGSARNRVTQEHSKSRTSFDGKHENDKQFHS